MLSKKVFVLLTDDDKDLVRLKIKEAVEYDKVIYINYNRHGLYGPINITQIELINVILLEQYYRDGGQLEYADPVKLANTLGIDLNDSDNIVSENNVYNLSVA